VCEKLRPRHGKKQHKGRKGLGQRKEGGDMKKEYSLHYLVMDMGYKRHLGGGENGPISGRTEVFDVGEWGKVKRA